MWWQWWQWPKEIRRLQDLLEEEVQYRKSFMAYIENRDRAMLVSDKKPRRFTRTQRQYHEDLK